MNIKNYLLAALLVSSLPLSAQKKWTMQECIDYAMANNISLKKSGLQRMSTNEDLLSSKAQLLPSLNFSTSQNINYRPWPTAGMSTVVDGQAMASVDKVYYNGSYSLNGNWTVWNGNRNHNQVKLNEIALAKNDADSTASARSIEEQIAQLYVQIAYTEENIKVQKATLEFSKTNENRGKDMVEVGKMSKADLMQLTAQRAQDEYNVVSAESQARNYKRQLKQLLQITSNEPFEISGLEATDAMALAQIPSLQRVYEKALANRPEFKSLQLQIESSEVSKKIANAQSLPTVSLNANAGTSTSSMSDLGWGNQAKQNFSMGAGVNVSVPIIDQRQKKTAVNKAEISRQQALLDLQDKQTSLYSNLENYWIQAENNQQQYKAAKVSTESAQTSYELLSEQFRLGLKNIVELQDGKSRLLSAQQSELQSKYMTILNIKMLEFYQR
jgi:outer membrane protein